MSFLFVVNLSATDVRTRKATGNVRERWLRVLFHFEVDDYLCTYQVTDSRLDCWTCCSTHVTCDGIVFALLFVCVCVQMRNCFVIVVVFVVGYSEGRQMRLPIGL